MVNVGEAMRELTFKKHVLSDAQRKWLRAARQPGFDPKSAQAKLWDELPPDFEADQIDRRLYVSDQLTPIGIWHVHNEDPIFTLTDRVASEIRSEIKADARREQITAHELASKLNVSEREAGEALFILCALGRYSTGASGVTGANEYRTIGLNDISVQKAYLRYPGIEQALEDYYVTRSHFAQLSQGQAMWAALEPPQVSAETAKPTRFQQYRTRVENHPVLSVISFAAFCVLMILQFTDAVSKVPYAADLLNVANPTLPTIPGNTGWIVLGVADVEKGNYVSGPYYKLTKSSYPDTARFPRYGEIIRLTAAREVYILGYQQTGLTNWKTRPVGEIHDADKTGVQLPKRGVVEIREISLGPTSPNPTVIWARVAPPAQ